MERPKELFCNLRGFFIKGVMIGQKKGGIQAPFFYHIILACVVEIHDDHQISI